MNMSDWSRLKPEDVIEPVRVSTFHAHRCRLAIKDSLGRWIAYRLQRDNVPKNATVLTENPEIWKLVKS